MLGRLILLLVQLGLGWFLGPIIVAKIPGLAGLNMIFIHAIVFAVLVWLSARFVDRAYG